MERELLVELKEYNVDYWWVIKEEELKRLLIEEFCEYYEVDNYFAGKSLVENYMLLDQVEKEFLGNVIENNLWELTSRFEYSVAVEIFKLLRTNKEMSLNEIEKALRRNRRFRTIILNSNSDVFLKLEDLTEFNGWELTEENETYTLKEAE